MKAVSTAQYFDDKLVDPVSPPKLLPVFHSCDALAFRSILLDKRLVPNECPVFLGENLVYLFYGRPAYKSASTEATHLNSYLPITFILDWNYIPAAKRVAPFDTGAFVNELYKEYMHHKMKVDGFLMRPEQKSAVKTTNFFFGKNSNYFAGKPKEDVKHGALDFEIESYLSLINGVAKSKTDDRKATIEVQLDSEISLTKDNLKAVILPAEFEATDIVRDVIKGELNAETLVYESYGVPSAYNYTHLLNLTKGFLVKNKYFLNK